MPRLKLHQKKRIFGYVCLVPAVVFIVILVVYPLFKTTQLSFQSFRFLGIETPGAREFSLKNYARLFGSSQFWNSLTLSGLYTIVATVFSLVIGLGSALMLNQKFKGQWLARVLMLIIWPIPSVALAVVFVWMFDSSFGVINYFLLEANLVSENVMWLTSRWPAFASTVTATVWKGYPFFTLMFLAGLQAVPVELYEAANVDGASALGKFRHITAPALRSVAVTATILNGLWIFRNFDFIYVMTGGGPARGTETLPIILYREAFEYFNVSYASAIGVISFLICALVIGLSMPLLKDKFYG